MARLRVLLDVLQTKLILLAHHAWEPLLALGPAALSLMVLPGLFFVAVGVALLVALYRFVRDEVQHRRAASHDADTGG